MEKFRIHPFILATVLLVISAVEAPSQTPHTPTRFRHARAFEEAGDFERAAILYQELLAEDSLNLAYFQGLQRVFLFLKRYDEAIVLIQRRLSVTPGDLNLHASLGSLYYKSGRESEADAAWEQALSGNPTDPQRYRIIANVMMENRLLEKAAETYRRGRIGCNDTKLFTIELAQLLAVSMDYRGASEEYVRWLLLNPAQLRFVQGRMGSFTWKEDGREAAIAAVRSALRETEDARLYELLGWLYLEGKAFDEAFEVFRHIDRVSQSQGMALFSFAGTAYQEGAYSVAASAYREAIAAPLPPATMPSAKYGYANAIKELGKKEDTLQTAVSANVAPASEAQLRYRGAIAYYRQVIEEYPGSEFAMRSRYQIGTIQLEAFFDLDGALASFEQVVTDGGGMPVLAFDAAIKIGEIHISRGDTTGAAERFQLVANAPNALPDQIDKATFRLAELEYFSGRFSEALEHLNGISMNLAADYTNDALEMQAFLRQTMEKSPDLLVQLARADLLTRQHNYGEAAILLRDVAEKGRGLSIGDRALMKTATLEEALGRYNEAIDTYERLLDDSRGSAAALDRAQFHIGEVYEFGLRDSARAIEAYEKLLAEYPDSVFGSVARKRIRHLRGDVF
ncbi:MAG: tetratricopeptide repeat protein [Bacteroidota bacterium]